MALAPFWYGCSAPIRADRVSTSRAYAERQANALLTGKPSAQTVALLHRLELDGLAARDAPAAITRLHDQALRTGERELLFALSELSYVAGEQVRRSVKPWDRRDPRDYYLGSAVYAWLYLFGPSQDPPPSPFDRRFSEACDFYSMALGLALATAGETNPVVRLESNQRRLPCGELQLQVRPADGNRPLTDGAQLLLANQFRIRGLSARVGEPGLGVSLIAVLPAEENLQLYRSVPATVLLRIDGGLANLNDGKATLEVYTQAGQNIRIGHSEVPVAFDLTAYRAYTLSQARLWRLGRWQFLAPTESIPNQLVVNEPYEPDRIPLVLVHGTFSSPVTWAEMVNTLADDPELRRHYQVWSFSYGSGNPLVVSIRDLRAALSSEVARLDPAGTNACLRQMVVIGHSQGGLLAKATAIDTGDRLWSVFSTNRFEQVKLSESDKAQLHEMLFLQPLPFVRRVVFIATPHRGSYLSGSLARRLARRLVSLPGRLIVRGSEVLRLTAGSGTGDFLRGHMPTSLDGMSAQNPGLLAMAEIAVKPPIKAHSIIPVLGDGDPQHGRDGVVAYESAHVDYVASEFIVRAKHSCLKSPATIAEVRRILHEHLRELDAP